MLPMGANRDLLQSRGVTSESIQDAFCAHQVVPDVIDRAPSIKLPLIYRNGVQIGLGSLQIAENVFTAPKIDMTQFDPNKFYSLIMTDPDVPNRAMPVEREFLHWLIVNIHENNLDKGLEVVTYSPPLPDLGTGLHRYVFLVLEQTTPISFSSSSPTPSVPTKPTDYFNEDRSADLYHLKSPATQKSDLKSSNTLKPDIKSPVPQKSDLMKSQKDDREQKFQKRDESNKKSNHVDQLSQNADVQQRLSLTLTPPVQPLQKRRESVPVIERKKFSTKEFIKKHTIRSVVAGNFFQTEHDEFVRNILNPPKVEEKKSRIITTKKVIETTEEIKTLKISKI